MTPNYPMALPNRSELFQLITMVHTAVLSLPEGEKAIFVGC